MEDLCDFKSKPKANGKKRYVQGWICLPCFKVRMEPLGDGCEMLFDGFLEKIFFVLFAPFWTGKVHFKNSEWEKLNKWEQELLSHES